MEKKLKFIIANCCQIEPSVVGGDAGINATPYCDSFGHLQIMVCVEQEFGVVLDTKTIAQLTSYKDILKYLKTGKKKNGK